MQRRILFAAAAVLLAVVLVVFFRSGDVPGPENVAGTMVDADQDAWAKNIGFQLAESLQSENSVIRANALFQAMYIAQNRKDADLKPAVPALLDVYKEDDDDQFRIAAVVALHAIAESAAMQDVRRALTSQTSSRVQAVSIALLHDFYGSETFENSPAEAQMAREILAEIDAGTAPVAVAAR